MGEILNEDKKYYYLQSIYLNTKNIFFEGSQELDTKPKNMSSKMEKGEIYIDWYKNDGHLSLDRRLIHDGGGTNISYALCDYEYAKKAFENGYEILVSYKPTKETLEIHPFFYFINKKNYVLGFDNALNYFKSVHHNKEFNFFLNRRDDYEISRKIK